MARTPQHRSSSPGADIPTGALDAPSSGPGSEARLSPRSSTENVISAAKLSRQRAQIERESLAPTDEEPSSRPSARAVPDEVSNHYDRRGSRYFLPGDQLAIVDNGRMLKTPLENAAVIQDMLAIHRARGHSSVEVTGSDNFRRTAWELAQSMGMRTRGYEPGPGEREKEEVAAKSAAPDRLIDSRNDALPATRGAEASVASGNAQPERASSAPATDDPRILAGRLVAAAEAHYRFDPRKPLSYFVKVDTPEGVVTRWGADLGRAVKRSLSNAQIGDEVIVRDLGERPVVVSRPVRDDAGEVVRTHAVTARMNRWSVERAEFIEERSRLAALVRNSDITPHEAVRDRPELGGTYDELARASSEAPRLYAHPDDQRRFVTALRDTLANEIARGEPLSQRGERSRTTERTLTSVQERALAQERVLY